ncbi:MAG: sodium:proton antiporter [Candidatus Rokuibacteriota bacterium]
MSLDLSVLARESVYLVAFGLLALGVFALIAHGNLMKKLIGLNIFQTAVILFFVATSAKWRATLPIVPDAGGGDAARYMNPLPHALMLTAIVVMVATLGVALALLVRLHQRYGSFEEEDLLDRGE